LVFATDVALMAVGARILITKPVTVAGSSVDSPSCRWRLALVGIAVGLLGGLLANAGGFVLVPLYLGVLRIPMKRALGSSLAVAAVLAVPGTVVHAGLGHVNWTVALAFGAASVPLSGLGARAALRMESRRLERIYGAGLLVLGVVFVLS
jgi:uncharacterized membrane protein YfcA